MPGFPHQITPVEGATHEKLSQLFGDAEDGFVQVGANKFFIDSPYAEHAEHFYNMEVRKDDVWIVTFPRSGTTWSQELVWLLLHDLDLEKARKVKHFEKVLFLEISILMRKKIRERVMKETAPNQELLKFFEEHKSPGYEKAKTMESPRCIKSHLMLSLLPPNLLETAKVVYVARQPKDAAVSNYYQQSTRPGGFNGTFDQFWPLFEEGITQFGPQVEHIKEAWDLRNHPNMFFYFYEDLKKMLGGGGGYETYWLGNVENLQGMHRMVKLHRSGDLSGYFVVEQASEPRIPIFKDLPGMIRKMAQFLGKPISDEQVEAVERHLSFDNMKSVDTQLGPDFVKPPKQPAQKGPVMEHFRKGKSGYSEEFKNIGSRADEWVENQSKRTGIIFPKWQD